MYGKFLNIAILATVFALPVTTNAQGGFLLGTETIVNSDFPVAYYMVETVDGLYVPVGLRKPSGSGPFPIVVFASGNGGGGLNWVKNSSHNRGWTLDRFLDAGYAVVWMRYRAEVELGFNKNERLIKGGRQGMQMFNRGPLEIDDEDHVWHPAEGPHGGLVQAVAEDGHFHPEGLDELARVGGLVLIGGVLLVLLEGALSGVRLLGVDDEELDALVFAFAVQLF